MIPHKIARNSAFILVLASSVLAACAPLVQIGDSKSPPLRPYLALYPRHEMVAGPLSTGKVILVSNISASPILDTRSLLVMPADGERAYLRDAVWEDSPVRLFQRLLTRTISSRGEVLAISPDIAGATADYVLQGELTCFTLDVRATPVVRACFNAVLSNPQGHILAARHFESTHPVSVQTPAVVAAALNDAANDIMAQAADWVVARMAADPDTQHKRAHPVATQNKDGQAR